MGIDTFKGFILIVLISCTDQDITEQKNQLKPKIGPSKTVLLNTQTKEVIVPNLLSENSLQINYLKPKETLFLAHITLLEEDLPDLLYPLNIDQDQLLNTGLIL